MDGYLPSLLQKQLLDSRTIKTINAQAVAGKKSILGLYTTFIYIGILITCWANEIKYT